MKPITNDVPGNPSTVTNVPLPQTAIKALEELKANLLAADKTGRKQRRAMVSIIRQSKARGKK
jgi:hypothetical protein